MRAGSIAVALSGMTFGVYGLLSKALFATGMKAPTILFWRFALASAILWIASLLLRKAPLPRERLLPMLLLGIAYLGMSMAYLVTIGRAGASYGVLLLYAYPAFVALFEHLLGNRLTRIRAISVALATSGILLLVHAPAGALDAVSIAIGLTSAVMYALYLVGSSRAMAGISSTSATTGVLTSVTLCFAILSGATTGFVIPTQSAALLLLALAVVTTAIPIALLSYGITRIGAPRAAILGTLEPLTSVILVVAFAGERLAGIQLLGAACLLACSALRDRRPTAPLEA